MCVTYTPPPPAALAQLTEEGPPELLYADEAWPGRGMPILLGGIQPDGQFALSIELAVFGLIPHGAKDRNVSHTHNARTETVASKPSFRTAWRQRQFCLVPMMNFREPLFAANGKSQPWRIGRKDQQMFTVAGIWDFWADPKTGERIRSFSMLTINADGHPIMGQFHRPEDEKRSLVVVPKEDWQRWLTATTDEARSLLKPMPVDEFTAEGPPGGVQPVKVRQKPQDDAPQVKPAARKPPSPPSPQGNLF